MHPLGGENHQIDPFSNMPLTEVYQEKDVLQIKQMVYFSLFGICDVLVRESALIVGPPICKMFRQLKHISFEEILRQLDQAACKKAHEDLIMVFYHLEGYSTERTRLDTEVKRKEEYVHKL